MQRSLRVSQRSDCLPYMYGFSSLENELELLRPVKIMRITNLGLGQAWLENGETNSNT